MYMLITSFLFFIVSEINPPSGRATKLMNANEAAISPANSDLYYKCLQKCGQHRDTAAQPKICDTLC